MLGRTAPPGSRVDASVASGNQRRVRQSALHHRDAVQLPAAHDCIKASACATEVFLAAAKGQVVKIAHHKPMRGVVVGWPALGLQVKGVLRLRVIAICKVALRRCRSIVNRS